METTWKFIERTILVAGFVIAAATLYYTAAPYYEYPKPATTLPSAGSTILPDWTILLFGSLGIALLVTGWAMLIARRKRGLPKGKEHLTNPSYHFPTQDWHEPLIPVVNQTYRNEIVQMDGKAFTDYRFEHVTFLYNCTKPTQMINCLVGPIGEIIFHTDNPVVAVSHEITNVLRAAAGEKGTMERNLVNKDSR
jgi:hypothetical protein